MTLSYAPCLLFETFQKASRPDEKDQLAWFRRRPKFSAGIGRSNTGLQDFLD